MFEYSRTAAQIPGNLSNVVCINGGGAEYLQCRGSSPVPRSSRNRVVHNEPFFIGVAGAKTLKSKTLPSRDAEASSTLLLSRCFADLGRPPMQGERRAEKQRCAITSCRDCMISVLSCYAKIVSTEGLPPPSSKKLGVSALSSRTRIRW